MTGLDNLLSEIQTLAQEEADVILRSAENEAAKIKDESQKQIESQTREILVKAETAAKNIMERGVSNQKIQQRNEILKLKQDLLSGAVAKAKQKIIELPDAEYFELLKTWAKKAGIDGKAAICMNAKDLARNQGDFLKSFSQNAEISLSDTPADISGGFLAVCGGVTINCSIDAMFEIHADTIHRELQRILFD